MEYQNGYYAPNTYPPVNPAPEVKPLKGNLIKLISDSRTRVRAIVAAVLMVACLAVIVLGWSTAMNQYFMDIPVVALAMQDQPLVRGEESQMFAELAIEYQETIDFYSADLQRELTPDEYRTVVDFAQVLRDCSGGISLNDMNNIFDGFQDLQDIVARKGVVLPEEYQSLANYGSNSDLVTAINILDGINNVLLVGMLICLVMALCGGLFRLRGLVIAGMIINSIYNVLFAGIIWMVLGLAFHIALLVLLGQLKKQCKATLV